MQVTETLNEGLKRGYSIFITADELNETVDQKLREAQPEVEMKGFRKGKVPLPRSGAKGVSYDNKLYFFGGYQKKSGNFYKDLFYYDL